MPANSFVSRQLPGAARIALLAAACACVGSLATAAPLGVTLERGDAPDQSVAESAQGSLAAYSRYRGPAVTWATGLSVDGKHAFDERDAQGRFVRRSTQLDLDLADGEHTIEPIGARFRLTAGKVQVVSGDLVATDGQVSLRLYGVRFESQTPRQPPVPMHVQVAHPKGELFRSPPGCWVAPLTLLLPASGSEGYTTNLSPRRLRVTPEGAGWVDSPADQSAPAADRFSIALPEWRITAALLLDGAPKSVAFSLGAREVATSDVDFEVRSGNWDPRVRLTAHGSQMVSQAGWQLFTGQQEWTLSAADQTEFARHVVIVDRPQFTQPGGENKERILCVALGTDNVTPGARVPARWRWIHQTGLEPHPGTKLVAFVQQAPPAGQISSDWRPVEVQAGAEGNAVLTMPADLAAGRAWLRIGLPDGQSARATDRYLTDVPLLVARTDGPAAVEPATTPGAGEVTVGRPADASRMPAAERRGTFLHGQNISAIDVASDASTIAVGTMAFRHDRNFWLLSSEGKVLGSRQVEPWCPTRVAVLDDGQTCVLGMAYSRQTDPAPTVSIFHGPAGEERAQVDGFWDLGWLRYGEGDWRSGWPVSILGDPFVKVAGAVETVASHDGAFRIGAGGSAERYPLDFQRPLRMAASRDGHVAARGYLAPDSSTLDEKTRNRLRLPPALLTVRDSQTNAELWSLAADRNVPAVPKPPEAADDFPELAKDFSIRPLTMIPFRAATSVAASSDGAQVALAEYGGWLRIKAERGIGSWNPDHPVAYCPRQVGRLRVFGPRGETVAETDFPAKGLFDVQFDPAESRVWCAPQSWLARGLAGQSWLPADPENRHVYCYDIAKRRWLPAWQFPDAVADLAVDPAAQRVLVSCWDGHVYALDPAGRLLSDTDVGTATRLAISRDGRLSVAGTQAGEVLAWDSRGELKFRVALPVAPLPESEPPKPVFAGLPIFAVGRVGHEHAYVGDTWLIKGPSGALLVDTGGTSGIPLTCQKLRAAGVEPERLEAMLLSHSHGDHAGACYLWRTLGPSTVAPQSAALTIGWLMPTWTDYGIWPPTPLDQPLPLKRAGDETEFNVAGITIRAIFAPGHSFDSVVYLMTLADRRVAFTGDIGFTGESHILHRAWGDATKARVVADIFRRQVLPFRPDFVFTGHDAHERGSEFLEKLVAATEAALDKR